MSLRVLHVLDHSIPLHSGYTFRTMAILREQRKLGWQTFHLTSPKHALAAGAGAPQDEQTVDGLHFYRTPVSVSPLSRWPLFDQWALMQSTRERLHAVAAQVLPHILHVHSPVLNAMPALSVGRQLGVPVVYEVRAFWEDAAVDHGSTTEGSLRYRATHALETRALRQADHVFTICEGLRKDIVGRGLPEQKVSIIANAVDIDAFEPGGRADDALKTRIGLGSADVVGFIGSFYAYEGLDLLLDALPALLQRRPSVRVLLVGGGPQEAALRLQAQRLGVADKVVYTGRVPHDQVKHYYDLIDILAYPRHRMRLTELVTPLKPLEAMAQGRVLVASDVGGHQELIRNTITGWLFKAGNTTALVDALDKAFVQREHWPDMRRAGRQYVETERNWAKSAANYVSVFDRLCR